MSHHVKSVLDSIFFWVGINVASMVVQNYDKITGSILTTLSIAYLIWKWINEYKKAKRYDNKSEGNRPN